MQQVKIFTRETIAIALQVFPIIASIYAIVLQVFITPQEILCDCFTLNNNSLHLKNYASSKVPRIDSITVAWPL